jgi:hypothetical protein
MHAKMQIYAEILRQIGRMPNDYKEPDMEDMGEMEEPEADEPEAKEYESPKLSPKGEKKER